MFNLLSTINSKINKLLVTLQLPEPSGSFPFRYNIGLINAIIIYSSLSNVLLNSSLLSKLELNMCMNHVHFWLSRGPPGTDEFDI